MTMRLILFLLLLVAALLRSAVADAQTNILCGWKILPTANFAIETWGASNALESAYTASRIPSNSAFSIEMSIKITNNIVFPRVLLAALDNSPTTEWEVYATTDGSHIFGFTASPNAGIQWYTPVSWFNTGWHHVLVQFNPTNGFYGLWFDGAVLLTNASSGTCPTVKGTTWAYHLGVCLTCSPGEGVGADEIQFDEVRICKTNMYPWAPFTPPALGCLNNDDANTLAHWRFNDGSGTTALDQTSNDRDLLFQFTPRWVTPGVCTP